MKIRPRGENVRNFILENVAAKTTDIASRVAEHFGITRQAACKHLRKLTQEKALIASGNTRNRLYRLAPLREWSGSYEIAEGLEEDRVWTLDIAPQLAQFPENVVDIWQFCFTEMFNNAIDHSGGTQILCFIEQTAVRTKIVLQDDGVGIFKKIQSALKLIDERHALLELSKGKLTTDPGNHSGQGIFFTSRMLDSFNILSGEVTFMHTIGDSDVIWETPKFEGGTTIFMELQNHTARTVKKIFDQYSSDENYDFSKTVIPVKLAQYGNDKLVSRSQAKRLLSRVDLFKTVVFDFAGLETIGQAFADEIFRVFARNHPNIALIPINASEEISKLVAVAEAAKRDDRQTRLVSE
jgi:STAS-like domain of unknown function (DUF4325)/Histidine kinase-like ATPase domain